MGGSPNGRMPNSTSPNRGSHKNFFHSVMHGVFHSGYIKTIRRGVANGCEIVYKKNDFPGVTELQFPL